MARLFFVVLLHLYPPRFRRRYRTELLECFDQDRRRPQFAGASGAARFWFHTLRDLLRTAATEWWWAVKAPRVGCEGRRSGGGLVADLRFAARSLRRDRTFSAVSIVTLGLGIGATTAVFTVVHSVLLRPLDFPDPDRLVRVYELERENPNARMVAYGNYLDLRDVDVFESLAIWAYSSHVLTGVDRAAQLRTREVSASFGPTLGAPAVLGRWISPDEERLGRRVVVLSYGLWQSAFGGDSAVLQRAITLDGEPYAVVGVMAPGFDYPGEAQAWVPLVPVTNPVGLRRWHRHNMVGRMRPGVTVEEVNRLLVPVGDRLAAAYPETNTGNYFEAVSLLDTMVAEARPTLRVLFGAVIVLLLIATVNLTSLVYARTGAREQEIAIRTALGASGARLGRMLLAECVVLAGAGGLAGLAIAHVGVRSLVALSSGAIPRADTVAVAAPVVLFAAAVSTITGFLLGLIPIRKLGSGRVAAAQALSGRRSSAGRRAIRSRRLLVTTELALALVLTVAAALLVRSFQALTGVDPSVDVERLLALDVRLPGGPRYETQADVARFLENVLPNVEAVPGVDRAAAMLTPPINDTGWFNSMTRRDHPLPEAEVPPIGYNVVSSGYFETVGVPLLAGRTFRPDEPAGGRRVAVINRAGAEQYWPNESPIGKLILGNAATDSNWVEIIGVSENVRQSLVEPPHPEVYVPLAQDRVLSFVVLVRTPGDASVAGRPVEQVLLRADPDMPISRVGPYAQRVSQLTARPRFSATLMGTFATLALVLACVGVYGLFALAVIQRRREIGIRIAVGADRTRVLGWILGDAAAMCAIAILLGVAGALGVSRLLNALLFGVSPTDPGTITLAAVAIAAVSLGAALVPARMATRVDPMVVLRQE